MALTVLSNAFFNTPLPTVPFEVLVRAVAKEFRAGRPEVDERGGEKLLSRVAVVTWCR